MAGLSDGRGRFVELAPELERALALSQIGLWRIEYPGAHFVGSRETCRILGLEAAEDLTEAAWLAPVHAQDLARVREAWQAVRRGLPVEMDYRLVVQGAVRSVHVRSRPELDDRGGLRAVDGTLQDVTLLARSEQALLGYAKIVEASGDALAFIDRDFTLQLANPAFLSLFGCAADAAFGQPLAALMGEAVYNQLGPSLARAMAGDGQRLNLEGLFSAGKFRVWDVDYQPYVSDGEVRGVVISVHDSTERSQMLGVLSQERDFGNAILEAAGSVIVVIDRNGRIVRFNRTAETLTGFEADQLIGQPIWERLIPPEQRDAVRQVFDHLLANRIVREYENEWLKRDGTRLLLQWRNNILTDAAGAVSHIVAQGYDITESRAKDALLRRDREQQATLSQLLEILLGGEDQAATLDRFLARLLGLSWLALEPGAAILLLAPDGQSLRIAAARNMDAQALSQCTRVPLGRCHCGRAAAARTIQFAARVEAGQDDQCSVQADRGHYALPLMLGERLQGVLVLYPPAGFSRDAASDAFLGTVTDILSGYLARKEDEEALRAGEDLTRGVMDSLNSGIAVLDRDGVVLRVNKAWQRAAQEAPEVALFTDQVGAGYLERVAEAAGAGIDSAREVLAGMLAVRDGHSPDFSLEYPVPAADPPRWFNIQVMPLGGSRPGLVVTQTNITQRKLAELELERYKAQLEDRVVARTAELRAAEAQVRLILESTADGLFGMGTDGCFTFVNPVAGAMLGYRAEGLVGRPVHDTIHHHHEDGRSYAEADCPMLETLRTGAVVRERHEVFWRADGSPLPVVYATHPMIRQGEIVGVVVGFSDETRAREVEAARAQALAEAERLARVRSEFLANMSHEIRTPLNAVLGLAQVGQRESEKRKSRDTFTRILDSGQLLLGIINDILDFSKIEAGRLLLETRPFSPAGAIDQAVSLVASRAYAKGLTFRLEEAADLPESCSGDALRLVQVLVNLLSNAVKFTHRGRVTLAAWQEAGALCFRVEDTGIGMTEAQLARLFKPFEQADGSTTRLFGGTGLGLAISKRLVDLMGGRLTVSSAPEQGARFEVRLPSGATRPWVPEATLRRVALLGFPADESARLQADLLPWQLRVVAPGADADLLLYDAEAAGDAVMAQVDAALARGRRVFRLTTPGRETGGAPPPEAVVTLDRPLRPRLFRAALNPAEPAAANDQDQRQRLAGIRVLAAEDNEVNRMVLAEMLESAGARLDCFENGAEAVAHLSRVAPGTYDIVLTDVQMPVMDGYETTRRIHALNPALPVVGVTAHALPEEKARCLATGMVEHVAKPMELETLMAVILRHVPPRSAWPAPKPAPSDAVEPASGPESATPGAAPNRVEPEDDTPCIDRALLEARFGGKKAFVEKLVHTALTKQQDSPEQLRQAAARGDLAALAFSAHALKGMAGNLAVARLQAQAAEAEQAARSGAANAPELALALATAMARFLARARS